MWFNYHLEKDVDSKYQELPVQVNFLFGGESDSPLKQALNWGGN